MSVEIISWSISTKVWYRAGIELATPGSAVRHASVARHVTDCATRPGLLISSASTKLHGICNGSINGIEDKCPPPPTPNFRFFFVWDSEGAQKFFILRDQTTGDLKSHHLQARATLTSLSVPPVCASTATFSFSRVVMWVIRYHIIMHYRIYTRNII